MASNNLLLLLSRPQEPPITEWPASISNAAFSSKGAIEKIVLQIALRFDEKKIVLYNFQKCIEFRGRF